MAFNRWYYHLLTLNAWYRFSISMALLLLIGGVWLSTVYRPLCRRIEQQQQKVKELHDSCREYETCAVQLEKMQQPYSECIHDIMAAASKAELTVDAYMVEKQTAKNGYATTKSSLTVSGSFEQIENFLAMMACQNCVRCKKCMLVKSDEHRVKASLNFLHYTF